MHPKVITKRGKEAEERLTDALAKLASKVGVTPTLPANSRDSDLRAVFMLESLSETAEAILNAFDVSADTESSASETNDKPKRGRPKVTN